MSFDEPNESAPATSSLSDANAPGPVSSTPRKPRVFPVLIAVLVAMAGQLALGAMVGFLIGLVLFFELHAAPNMEEQIMAALPLELLRAPWIAASIAITGALLLSMSFLVARLSSEPAAFRLGWRRRGPRLKPSAAVALAAIAFASILLASVVIALGGIKVAVFEAFVASTRNATPLGFALLLVCGGIIAPCAEELFFRGVVQTRLVARYGAVIGIGFTSVLFGVFHLDLAHAAFATFVGLCLGILRHFSGTIHLAILVHMLNNLLAFGLPRFISAPDTQSSAVGADGVVVVVALIVAVVALRRSTRSGLWRREDDAS